MSSNNDCEEQGREVEGVWFGVALLVLPATLARTLRDIVPWLVVQTGVRHGQSVAVGIVAFVAVGIVAFVGIVACGGRSVE